MKNIFLVLVIVSCVIKGNSQDFDKNLATAKSAYASGKLEDARFAMEQMLGDLDRAIGTEILKMLPPNLGGANYNDKDDNVTGTGGSMAAGLYVHRSYGTDPNKKTAIDIINNSPLITSINAILSMPMIGSMMMRNDNQKVIKVQGYKSLLNKNVDSSTGKTNYELQIPMNNTLMTIKMDNCSEDQITAASDAIPLQKIAQFAQ